MSEFGTIGTVDEVKRQLMEYDKTFQGLKYWEEMYGSVSLMGKQAESAVTYDYAKAMSEAYASSLQTDMDIMSSNLGQGFKERELSENQLALEEAFASYQQNYLEGMQTVAKTTAEAEASVTSQLETEAKNVEGLNASVYNYLEYLFKKDPNLLETLGWQEYLNYTPKLDAEGKEITDEEGKVVYNKSLKSWDELTTPQLDDNNEYISLVDNQGYLTSKGIDFYDKIMNQINTDQYGVSSWQNWLRETNPELYNWSQSYNPYNHATYVDPNTGEIKNTNIGSFRTLVGLKPGDQTYSFAERFAGMTKKEVDESLSKFIDYSNKLSQSTSNIKDIKNYTNEIKSLITKYGISEDLAKEGININELDRVIEKALETYKEPDTVNSNPHKGFFGTVWDWMVGAGRTVGKTGKLLVTGRKDYTFDDFGKDIKDIWTDYDTDMSDTEAAILMYKNLVQLVSSLAEEKRKKAQTQT